VPQVVVTRHLTGAELEALRQPRDDLVREEALDQDRFGLATGPFHEWHRALSVTPAVAEGRSTVVETFRFRLAVPVWGPIFSALLKLELRRGTGRPWWMPPARLDVRSATVLSVLAVVSIITGYLGTLLTQTNTFFKDDFGVSDSAVGWTLSIVRIGALLALAVVAVADRRGRRQVLLVASVLGCVATALGALAPGLVWLGASQTVARAFSTSMALLISIVAVEETPAGSRAWAVSVLTMAGALGAGIAVMLLWVADLGLPAWRLLYLVPLLALGPLVWASRLLPETFRFVAAERRSPARVRRRAARGRTARPVRARPNPRRLALLAASGLFFSLFVSPASGFLNEYLRTDQGFDATGLIAFNILTNTPGGIGIIIGGRLADARGRRLIGAIGVAGGVGFTVLMYLGTGWEIWLFSMLGAIVGAMAIPALAVYGPELFPTDARGRANGIINIFSVLGSAAGLAAAGVLADRLAGGLSHAIALLAAGPVVVVALVLFLYPETASRELEELNPEDAPVSRELFALEGLDVESLPERYPPRSRADEPDG
jgi:MFS family permease